MAEPLPELPRDVYALLAQANLLRMRGCWQEAIDRCMDAMRLAPNAASVHSLLGDIYDNRGSLDDAIQWYRMALDVYPDSPADRVKLARLLDAKARQSLPPPAAAPLLNPAPAASFQSLPAPVRALVGTDPERFLRRAAYSAGLVVLVIVGLAVLLSRPVGQANAWPGTRQISAPPVVLPSVTAPAPPVSASVPRDPAEADVLDAVRADGLLAGGDVSVADAQSDPRQSRLTLTIVVAPAANAPATRDSLLRDALHVAQAAGRVPSAQNVSAFTVRCVVSNGSGGTTLALVADTTRDAANAVGTAPAPSEQVAGAFSGVWWSPSAPSS